MKHARTSLFLALVSLGAVLWLAIVDAHRASPGPLSAAHGALEKLAGRSGCAECHGGLLTSMTSACRECHTDVAQAIDAHTGLHGKLDAELAPRCALCHGEHLGAGFASINPQSFRQAGFARIADFDHEFVGWTMSGKHLELDCARCHKQARKLVLAENERRYLGLKQECQSCHEDVHKGAMRQACVACHGQQDWKVLASQGHERFLPLVGGHADLSCRECHPKAGARSLEAHGATASAPPTRTCAECHASPHEERFLEAVSRAEKLPREEACVRCHKAEHTSFRESSLDGLTPEQHALTGFRLDEPHAKQSCAQCHAPEKPQFRARYPGRGMDQCESCHADPHGGQFASGPFAGGGCLACHERLRFTPHTFDAQKHAQAALPLEGAHAKLECDQCHARPSPEAPRAFRGTDDTCATCHKDAHQGFFDVRTASLAPVAHGDCARCHGVERFADVPGFEHGRWTGFDVRDAHAQEECGACHVARAEPDAAARRFGTVAEHFGAYQDCATCHADPHGGLFDRAGRAAHVEGRPSCARCHGESSWRALPFGFEHGAWTGFDLRGGHASAECSSCHAHLAAPDAQASSFGHARGPGCADCHPDPHGGQFAGDGRIDCARCHAAAAPAFVSFDHERDARFALGEAHAKLACSACHTPLALPQGGEVVRYRPLPTECVDCHGVREDVLLRRKRGGG